MFHDGGYRCLKHYYANYICVHSKHLFPRQVSYNRFVELERKVMLQLCCFVKTCLMAECSGVSYVDSTPLRVCRNQRILQHKVFKGFAERGKCSMGWFYGFKLHLIINDRGEILNFMITPANVDDREPLKQHRFVEKIEGSCSATGDMSAKSCSRNCSSRHTTCHKAEKGHEKHADEPGRQNTPQEKERH